MPYELALLLDDGTERSVVITEIDKARTVFEWGPKPKPGKQSSNKSSKQAGAKPSAATTQNPTSTKEKQPS